MSDRILFAVSGIVFLMALLWWVFHAVGRAEIIWGKIVRLMHDDPQAARVFAGCDFEQVLIRTILAFPETWIVPPEFLEKLPQNFEPQ